MTQSMANMSTESAKMSHSLIRKWSSSNEKCSFSHFGNFNQDRAKDKENEFGNAPKEFGTLQKSEKPQRLMKNNFLQTCLTHEREAREYLET